jgi:CRISPR-associated protein Csm5
MLTAVQAFFHSHREKLLAFANMPIPTASGVKALYEKRIGKTAQQESQGRRVINKLEIERTSYNPVDGHPFLPGSSIKGAIRTALLDGINDEKPLNDRNERSQKLQERLFGGTFHTDPMRLVSIGDASWKGSTDRPSREVKFAVNRKRKRVIKDGNLVPSQAEASNLYQLLECIAPHHYQSFNGSLTLLNTESVTQAKHKLPKQDLHWTIKEIAEACNAFYIGLFRQEINAMRELDYIKTNWLEPLEKLLDADLLKRLNAGEAFLLRVGRHSGGEALTLNGVRNIMIKGQGRDRTWEKQPKTWWFASDEIGNKTNLLPFGWILVEIEPKSTDVQLQQWLENDCTDLSNWMPQQLAKQNQLKQNAEFQQRIQQEKIAAEQQHTEELRLKQEAEQQRLADLSPIEQEIESFLKPIPAPEHDTRLLQELEKGRWQDSEAKIVAKKIKDLMEQAGKWLPDFTGDNKQKVKLKERSQKVLKYLRD